jgi:CarD family transcriptional regulator
VRDLHRTDDQREQSYSERQLYEAALERLTREIAVVNGSEEVAAGQEITAVLMARIVPIVT